MLKLFLPCKFILTEKRHSLVVIFIHKFVQQFLVFTFPFKCVPKHTGPCSEFLRYDLVNVLENEAGSVLSWLEQNEMIANLNKFDALFVKKDQTNNCDINLDFQGHSIKSEETVKLLGITPYYKLIFDPHISNLCKKKLRLN